MELTKIGNNDLIFGYLNPKAKKMIPNKNPIFDISFGTFEEPVNLTKDDDTYLTICVDHNFDISNIPEESTNIIFIDHHLQETINNVEYSSNSKMMVDNYEKIKTTLKEILNRTDIITIYCHCDLDGLASGLILKAMLNDIESGIHPSFETLTFLKMIGEYGDTSDDAPNNLPTFFNNKEYQDIYNNKIKSWTRGFSRFMKAIRSSYFEGYFDWCNFDTDEFNRDIRKYPICKAFNDLTKGYNITITDCFEFITDILSSVCTYNNPITIEWVILFLNRIGQSKIVNDVLDCYNKESARFIKNYLDPTMGCTEINGYFEGYINDKYKLLVIDSPLDLGRSVLWKYRSDFKYMAINATTPNKWYFKGTDYLNVNEIYDNFIKTKNPNYDIICASNIVCYNSLIKKLSIDGRNAYDIAVSFDGGGHKCMENGENGASLGSVVVENDSDFIKKFKMVEIR